MKNILVVDDSALTRRALCDIINSDERFHVQDRAADGIEALEFLCVKEYDAVVLDLNMPRMGGLELLKELRARKIVAKVLVSSAYEREDIDVMQEALELGALAFVPKSGSALDFRVGDFQESFLNALASVVESKAPVFEPPKPKTVEKAVEKPQEIPKPKVVEKAAEKAQEKPQEIPKPKAVEKVVEKAQEKPQEIPKPKAVEKAAEKVQEKPQEPPKPKTTEKAAEKVQEKPQEPPKPKTTEKVVEKPQEPSKPKAAHKSKAVERLKAKLHKTDKLPTVQGNKIVAIASSTGGPKALQSLIPNLPGNLNAPVVIVQHMPEGFTMSLAERLDYLSEIRVKEAEEGDVLGKGVVYIARGGKHLNVVTKSGKSVIHYTDEPTREGVKPCANYMYESLTGSDYDQIVCVVMTGMGSDGTKGIMNLKEKKELYVIAQEAGTCAVYGMPRSIVESGLANQIVPLEQLAQEITMNVGVK